MNIKKISVFILAAALAAGAFRFSTFKFFFDSSVGFFTDKGLMMWIALCIIFLVSIVITVRVAADKTFYGRVDFKRSIPTGIVCLVSAAVSGFGVKLLYDDWSLMKGNEVLTSIGVSMRLPFYIGSAVLALFFAAAAAAKLSGINIFAKAKLVYLISVIWSVILILYVFIHYSISVLKTENLFITLASCVTAVAFLQQAKFYSDINDKGRALRIGVPATAASAMLMLSYSLSDIGINMIGIERKNPVAMGLEMLMLAVGIYMLLVLFTVDYSQTERPEADPKRKARHFKK